MTLDLIGRKLIGGFGKQTIVPLMDLTTIINSNDDDRARYEEASSTPVWQSVENNNILRLIRLRPRDVKPLVKAQ